MKELFSILVFVHFACFAIAQHNPYWQEPSQSQVDSLKNLLPTTGNDTLKMYINRQLGLYYQEINRATALAYYESMYQLVQPLKQPVWEAEALSRLGYVSGLMQNYSGALKFLLEAEKLVSEKGLEKGIWRPALLSFKGDNYHARMTVFADIINHMGVLHFFAGDYKRSLTYHDRVLEINKIIQDDALMTMSYLNRGEDYMNLGMLDAAEKSFKKSIGYTEKSGYKKYKGLTFYDLGEVYRMRGNIEEAKRHYKLSVQSNIEAESPDFEGMAYQALASAFHTAGNTDSLFFYARKALNIYQVINDTLGLIAAHRSLADAFFDINRTDSAYQHLQEATRIKDALNKEGRIKQFQSEGFKEQIKLEEQKAEQLRSLTRIRTYFFIAGIVVLLIIGAILYKNYKRQKKDKDIIERAFSDLKSTQAQLIQSEKMASLGELTAGIAHEIQNPLNFVNNFSEVSNELVDEMNGELDKGDISEAKAISNDIKQNLEKINHHGKRADAIVKGMLQHSRSSSGTKEPTDINALADEYLRLAYHGLRAKDKTFNATMKTEFDDSLENVNVIPQDMGRVILNLITNAFFVVNEKKKTGVENFEPTVTLSTRKNNGMVEVSVKDNGDGIPKNILDKIFQPFFTTKPTGQGTGLGLSLAYDIVKAHGGELKVKTAEGKGTEFIIIL